MIISFLLSGCCKKEHETEPDPVNVLDVEGNIYDVVRIGKQLWMKGNLKTTKFNIPWIILQVKLYSILCQSRLLMEKHRAVASDM